MILDILLIALTSSIAIAATVMAIGLLRREPGRTTKLSALGLTSLKWSTAIGVSLLAAVVALVAGWWIKPLGIAAIVVIKVAYVVTLMGYRRANKTRDRDLVSRLMSAHSLAAVASIILLATS